MNQNPAMVSRDAKLPVSRSSMRKVNASSIAARIDAAAPLRALDRKALRDELYALRTLLAEARSANLLPHSDYVNRMWEYIEELPASQTRGQRMSALKTQAAFALGADPGEYSVISKPVLTLLELRINLCVRELGVRPAIA
jgi:hypothetical protein